MFFQAIYFWNPEGRAMKTVFLLLLLLSTGGCAAKQWTTHLHHFAEGYQRAQEREIRRCWQAGCFWDGPGRCPRHGLDLRGRPLHFGIRATGIDEAWIAAAVPKD